MTDTVEPTAPTPPAPSCCQPWWRGAALAVIWAAVVLTVLQYDPTLLRRWHGFVGDGAWANLLANFLTDSFKTPYVAVGLVLIWRLDRRLKLSFLGVTVAVMITQGLVSGLLKDLSGRLRPADSGGLSVFEGLGGSGASFPSGHACGAFALASVLTLYYPRWRWLFCTYGVLVALARVQLDRHFFSDVIAGGVIGWYWALVMVSGLTWLAARVRAARARRAAAEPEGPAA
jgi:membrane-associated phospholipid phosphatase